MLDIVDALQNRTKEDITRMAVCAFTRRHHRRHVVYQISTAGYRELNFLTTIMQLAGSNTLD